MSTMRMFVAVDLPGPVRDILHELAEPIDGVTWTRREQLHLTLRFLGDVDSENLPAISERLAAVQVEPFLLPVEGVGAFPPKGPPHVVWAGTGSGHPRLFQLRQRLDDALLAAGINLDVRTFHPHITLGRCVPKAERAVSRWINRHREFAGPLFNVAAIALYRSELEPQGAVHTIHQQFLLSA